MVRSNMKCLCWDPILKFCMCDACSFTPSLRIEAAFANVACHRYSKKYENLPSKKLLMESALSVIGFLGHSFIKIEP